MNMLLIFNMYDLNGELFLKISFLFLDLASLSPSTVILDFTAIYASLSSDKSDLNLEVLNLIFLLTEYYPLDKPFTSIHLFVRNFETVELFNNLDTL